MDKFESKLGYSFKNKQLLNSALCHSSIKRFAIPFERLEFLGDRVLGVITAEYIYRKFTEAEGSMARKHAAFVCADSCYKVALRLGVDRLMKTAGAHLKTNKTVLADAMEAILGAVFMDSDYDTVRKIILNLWHDIFDQYDEFLQEPKTQLQEICQAKSGATPVYELRSVTGPDHKPEFLVALHALGKTIEATGNSKKEAETKAALAFLKSLKSI